MRPIVARLARVGCLLLLPALLLTLPGTANANDPPNIQNGSNGYWVRVAQKDLSDVGYSLPITGYFGAATKAQVNAFKKAHGLPQDGQIAYPRAWQALETAVKHMKSLPVRSAHLNSKGLAVAPADAPVVVKRAIAAANRIAFKPYLYGGGHGSWQSSGYDCSGSVSYALHGAGLLWQTEDSTQFESYDAAGYGRWMTIYANAGHAYMRIAGLWFDTADQGWGSYGHGDRWSKTRVSPASGYVARRPYDF